MADFIVIRLTPATPIDGTTFTNYLNGLTVKAYDISYANPKIDVNSIIGTAQYLSPIITPQPFPFPPLITYQPNTTIAQDFRISGTAVNFQSVATAVIPIPAVGVAEYISPSIQIEFDRPPSQPIVDGNVYYEVVLYSNPIAPTPDLYLNLPPTSVSAYVTLPATLNSALVQVQIPTDGTPPNFDQLLSAVTNVLSKDPGGVPPAISTLRPDECRNIAYEIIWGPHPPLPALPEDLDSMYTNPPNTGSNSDSNEQDRQDFQGKLNSYYATNNAKAERLTNYVFALAAAAWCEQQSQSATSAILEFPVNPGVITPLTTVKEASVILTGALTIDVPAQYFYVLGAQMPTTLSPAQRYQLACGGDQQHNLTQFSSAVDADIITVPPSPGVNPAQAARMLSALAVPASSLATPCPLTPSLLPLWTDWLNYPTTANWTSYTPGDDSTKFWPNEASTRQSAFLDLVLCALTQGYVSAPTTIPPTLLADVIKANLLVTPPAGPPPPPTPIATVADLAQALPSDWQNFFAPQPAKLNLLPPFTLPGTPDARVTAFIHYVQKFFAMPAAVPKPPTGPTAGPPTLDLPTVDWIEQCIAQYGGLVFGTPLTVADLRNLAAAAAVVFPGDPAAQAWVVQAIVTLNDLTICANLPGQPASLQFSVMEALFARGFTTFEAILDLPLLDFQQALTGTVAYDFASTIYANAGMPKTFPTPGTGSFGPINDGSLTNCIPPLYVSPLSPVAYLHDMLQLSEAATCADPDAPPLPSHTQLEAAIDARRGPLGSLEVTRANLATPLPMIDLVNECLEYMASTKPPAAHGTVYNTAGDALAGHLLCTEEDCSEEHEKDKGDKEHCHKPARIFAALPEYSTPATPVADNASVTPAVYNILKSDFSACGLPYSQALDVSRTYLREFRTCRFELMRTFHKCITEFVLDPLNEPAGFQSYLWRYPVRIDIAIEYLGITSEEYQLLFQGIWPQSCAENFDTRPDTVAAGSALQPWRLYGFAAPTEGGKAWTDIVVSLPEFLKRTCCLTYCEFLELWKPGFVQFSNGADPNGIFPECEPCCLEDLWLAFPAQPGASQALYQLAIFIRFWCKLKDTCDARYSFTQLADICNCNAFSLFIGSALNPDFVRQLAAFQMLRDHFHLKLVDKEDKPAATATGADRTHLLALWVGDKAHKWNWAVEQLIDQIEDYAECQHKCERRGPEFIKLLRSNLDALAQLAGFAPSTGTASDTWYALPTHTLRFAEILAKIYASNFSISELLYLFTADDQLDGDEPFPLQEKEEAFDLPLSLPDDEHRHSLWHLRHKLLHVHVSDEDAHQWHWKRIEAALQHEFGNAPDAVLAFAQHFFPATLEAAGYTVNATQRRFSTGLPLANTVASMWHLPLDGPFQYDAAAQLLHTRLPLKDEDVIEQLRHVHALDAQEQQAVQNVYFQPRAALATFAFLFSDFDQAQRHLIEEHEEHERWAYFQRQFALCHARCRIIAHHLADHVAAATGQEHPEGVHVALLVLRELFADENKATTPWEDDSGKTPSVTWTPLPNGGALAALLGLTGTGLLREFMPTGGSIAWRDVGTVGAFGRELDRTNCPVPTVLPSMSLALVPNQSKFVTVLNGLAMRDADGTWLGGAQGFKVKWSGALLIDEEGTYEFCAGAPTGEGEKPNLEAAKHRTWRVLLKRGQKTWLLLNHGWHGEKGYASSSLPLKHGAYELIIEFHQFSPDFLDSDDLYPQHTGFQLKYAGPDSHGELVQIPHSRLFRISKDDMLAAGIAGLATDAQNFLLQYYTSSLRDIRRTYQRAFKAILFAHRFGLSAKHLANGQSELGYMLAQPENFAGVSYYRSGGSFAQHAANFDFNFLPLQDTYDPPTPGQDARVQPSAQRTQALFDWWERTFDYALARKDVHRDCHRHLWHLFEEAQDKQPTHPGYLLRHLCADSRHWHSDLRYYQDQFSPVYAVTSADLADDRWVVRAWHSDRWLCRLTRFFRVKDVTEARPDLWSALDPSALVAGETEIGNANLLQFLCDGCFENGELFQYDVVKRLNDGLRQRGRHALLAYLCGINGIVKAPKELSELLLLDVEVGIGERASRIDEAISAVQTFIQRARLGLEPGWQVSHAFALLWDSQFATYHVWEACKRRHLYKENWIDWHELERAKKVEAFHFLDEELRRVTLTIAVPGGVDYWPDERPPLHSGLTLLQKRDPATMKLLLTPREGLDLLATPERAARPSWLTLVPEQSQNMGPGSGPPITITAPTATPTPPPQNLPFWMEAAIKLGTRFLRVAAAAYPPASTPFAPHEVAHKHDEDCVECCTECEHVFRVHIDEYYFWLVDARHFDALKQDEYYDQNTQEATPWHEPVTPPTLLDWPSQPMLRLAWCRVHNGEFQQPRRSIRGIEVPATGTGGTPPDLSFQGRSGDSLYFDLTNASTTSTPGFRYDLATDEATVSPNLVVPPVPLGTYLSNLDAYPYFVYFAPGARLFPWSLYTPAIAVADALRAHCRFEAALKWYRLVYDPLQEDNTWMHCPQASPPPPPPPVPPSSGPVIEVAITAHTGQQSSACCDSTDVSCAVARHRSIVLHYLETLLQWGEALMRHNSPESVQQARLILDTAEKILGKHPHSVLAADPPVVQTVTTFIPLFAPLNPRLMLLYEHVEDRLVLIHERINARRLRNEHVTHSMAYWGNDPLREGWRSTAERCCEEEEWCHPHSPYRFLFLVQKAQELAGRVRELGSVLLAAFEKGDAEYLASVRARHEQELFALGRKVREDQWRDADWQVQALGKTKESQQASRRYYAGLILNGLNGNESQYVALTGVSLTTRTASNVIEAVAEIMDLIPDLFVGFPCEETQLPVGTKLAGMFKTIARITNTLADIAGTTASLDLTEGGWDRRLQDWQHQVEVLDIEIEQMELQILGAERRRDQALRELNNQQRQIENATEVLNFLRDKFTNHAVYLWLQKKTAEQYYKMYELALYASRQAEHAFNFERGHTTKRFITDEAWNNLHEGLLAGERLQLCLSHMEKAYLDLNVREYELTKHLSLRLHFPMELLRLKLAGRCEIELPEWLFDLDYPGQYMRRIKNVSLTIPCVAGPYTGVHCRLTLLHSETRIDPVLERPVAHCCNQCGPENGYEACPHDPRIVRQYTAREAIATSSGQNDTGLFELNFRDDRYLPFEYQGAVSRWRIELPPENNYFEIDTVSDVIVHLNYTAREGGELLRKVANHVAHKHLPGSGWCLFDVRHDFPDAWASFRAAGHDNERPRQLKLTLNRNLFPFIPGGRELWIDKIALLFEASEGEETRCEVEECPCPEKKTPACYEVEFAWRKDGREDNFGSHEDDIYCVASDDWPELYYGTLETRSGPLGKYGHRNEARFRFPSEVGEVPHAYLLCHYEIGRR